MSLLIVKVSVSSSKSLDKRFMEKIPNRRELSDEVNKFLPIVNVKLKYFAASTNYIFIIYSSVIFADQPVSDVFSLLET